MPFVPFKKKDASDSSTAPAASGFSKKFARKRKTGKRAPAQKALTQPAGRSLSGGGR